METNNPQFTENKPNKINSSNGTNFQRSNKQMTANSKKFIPKVLSTNNTSNTSFHSNNIQHSINDPLNSKDSKDLKENSISETKIQILISNIHTLASVEDLKKVFEPFIM